MIAATAVDVAMMKARKNASSCSNSNNSKKDNFLGFGFH